MCADKSWVMSVVQIQVTMTSTNKTTSMSNMRRLNTSSIILCPKYQVVAFDKYRYFCNTHKETKIEHHTRSTKDISHTNLLCKSGMICNTRRIKSRKREFTCSEFALHLKDLKRLNFFMLAHYI